MDFFKGGGWVRPGGIMGLGSGEEESGGSGLCTWVVCVLFLLSRMGPELIVILIGLLAFLNRMD